MVNYGMEIQCRPDVTKTFSLYCIFIIVCNQNHFVLSGQGNEYCHTCCLVVEYYDTHVLLQVYT